MRDAYSAKIAANAIDIALPKKMDGMLALSVGIVATNAPTPEAKNNAVA